MKKFLLRILPLIISFVFLLSISKSFAETNNGVSEITTPTILGFSSPTSSFLPCGVTTNLHTATVDWTDSTGGVGGISGYEYNIVYPKIGGGIGVWNSFFTNSQYTGSLNEGTHTIKVRARDSVGNVSEWSNVCKIFTDFTPPPAPEIIFPNPEQYFNSIPIRNEWLPVNDKSAIAYYRLEYEYDDGHRFFEAPYRTTKQTSREFRPEIYEQNGVKFRVQAFDNAGNEGAWSEWRHFYYDTISPVVPSGIYFLDTDYGKTIQCNEYTNTKHLKVFWDAITGDPSFSHFEYSSYDAPNGKAGLVEKIFYTNYFDCSYWQIPKEGTYGVQLRSVDKAGNKSTWYGNGTGIENSCKFIVDWTKPNVEVKIPRNLINGIVDIGATFQDINPKEYSYTITNSLTNTTIISETVTSGEFIDTTIYTWDTTSFDNGEYKIYFVGKDKAGNISEDEKSVIVDNEKPEASVLGNLLFTIGNSPSQIITVTDNNELESICYTLESSYTCFSISGILYSWDITSLINSLPTGNTVLSYYVIDKAGNQSDSDIISPEDLPYFSTITVQPAPTLQEVLGATTHTKTTKRLDTAANTSEKELLQNDTEEILSEEELILEEEPVLEKNGQPEVLAATDLINSETKTFPWWIYLIIAAIIGFIIFLLWKKRKEENKDY